MRRLLTVLTCGTALALAACRGDVSEKPPLHVNPNMDDQVKVDPQESNAFFADQRGARQPVPGTVMRGSLHDGQEAFFTGMADGVSTTTYLVNGPLPVTEPLLRRGQERFNIYCAVCHDRAGTGKGLVTANYKGFPPPPSFHEDRIRTMADGEIFNTITHGIRTMPSYAAQIPESDRWAIIAYLRALERSQHAALADVPEENRSSLGTK